MLSIKVDEDVDAGTWTATAALRRAGDFLEAAGWV